LPVLDRHSTFIVKQKQTAATDKYIDLPVVFFVLKKKYKMPFYSWKNKSNWVYASRLNMSGESLSVERLKRF
jgi:uncharacterized membrane protein